jgi:hypothetical protein
MRASGQKARRGPNETLIHNGHFKEVLGQSARVKVVVVRFADATEEAHWAGPSKLELQHAEHESFGLEDFLRGIAIVDHVDNLMNRGAVDFLILGCDEDGCCADELQLAQGDDLARQESVDVVDAEEQGLWQ